MQNTTPSSLAAVAPGDAVIVQRVLFELLRDKCSDLDVREGDALHCQAVGDARIFLRTADGRLVACRRDWARFVEVTLSSAGQAPAP